MGRRMLDFEKRVLVDPATGSEETLTASDFNLLKVFTENPNRPLQRDWLLETTSHREMEAFDRAIDLRITRLRRKMPRCRPPSIWYRLYRKPLQTIRPLKHPTGLISTLDTHDTKSIASEITLIRKACTTSVVASHQRRT